MSTGAKRRLATHPFITRAKEGQALAAEYDVRFIEASAKADVNVTEAFQAIAQQVIDRIPRGMSRPASRQLSSKKSSKKSCSC